MYSVEELQEAQEPYDGRLYRVVEDQGPDMTALLIDDSEEADILEGILEDSKPQFPEGIPTDPHFYLLTTPFRYQRAYSPTRFRPSGADHHVLYASEFEETALFEFAYWRLITYLDSPDVWPQGIIEAIGFCFKVSHPNAINLTAEPFTSNAALNSKSDHSACHQITSQLLEAGTAIVFYQSARDPEQRRNAAVFVWEAIDPNEGATTTGRVSLIFKEDRVIIRRGPRTERFEISNDLLLG